MWRGRGRQAYAYIGLHTGLQMAYTHVGLLNRRCNLDLLWFSGSDSKFPSPKNTVCAFIAPRIQRWPNKIDKLLYEWMDAKCELKWVTHFKYSSMISGVFLFFALFLCEWVTRGQYANPQARSALIGWSAAVSGASEWRVRRTYSRSLNDAH